MHRFMRVNGCLAVCLAWLWISIAVAPAQTSTVPCTPLMLTSEQDHQHMVDEMGIKAVRPGFSGDESAPNHANYDPAKANPFPDLPDPLTTNDGKKGTTPEMWWKQRRPEIVEDYEREVYGRLPKNIPTVSWTVTITDPERVGFVPVVAKRVIGHVDNSGCPQINVDISMTVVLPAQAKGPVPVLMMFGRSVFPAPNPPNQEEFELLNKKLKQLLAQDDPQIKAIFEQHPAWNPIARPTFPAFAGERTPEEELVAAGWGYAAIDPASIQADNSVGLSKGIIGLVNQGQLRKLDDWGSLRAWAWGAARGLDYLETDPAVDAKHVGIEGVSRYGKAALVTMAFEPRFFVGLIGSSGKGGVTPLRRNWGEAVENLAGSGASHWMAGNFVKYSASEAKFGSKTPGDLPVDSNELIALCAPRLIFVSYGIPEKGDARWLDHQGSFMATVDAGRVYRLLGANDLGVTEDYHTAKMPAVNAGLLDGELAWRQHDGGHTDAPNMKYFIQWANKFIHRPEQKGR